MTRNWRRFAQEPVAGKPNRAAGPCCAGGGHLPAGSEGAAEQEVEAEAVLGFDDVDRDAGGPSRALELRDRVEYGTLESAGTVPTGSITRRSANSRTRAAWQSYYLVDQLRRQSPSSMALSV